MKTDRMQKYEDIDGTITIEVYRHEKGSIFQIDLHVAGNHKISIVNQQAINNLFLLFRTLPID